MKLIFIIISILIQYVCISKAIKLKGYNVDPELITVSGISSGAALAVQLQVAYSSVFKGAGVIAGSPYYCALGSSLIASTTCMSGLVGIIPLSTIFSQVSKYVSENLVDDTSNLKKAHIYIYSGIMDFVVSTGVVKKTEQFFQNYIPLANIKAVYSISSAHGFITNNYGKTCSVLATNFFNNCNYNQAFQIIHHLYPDKTIVEPDKNAVATGDLIEFDQSEFFPAGSGSSISMDNYAYVYVPKSCANGAKCGLHVALHGCLQGKHLLGNEFPIYSGYNQVGDLNNMIILYPQATLNLFSSLNPSGCWDWWGYTDSFYATKKGTQMRAIKAMVDRIIN